MEPDSLKELLSEHITKVLQQHTWDDYWLVNYWEELNDKDLGIIRKIKLK